MLRVGSTQPRRHVYFKTQMGKITHVWVGRRRLRWQTFSNNTIKGDDCVTDTSSGPPDDSVVEAVSAVPAAKGALPTKRPFLRATTVALLRNHLRQSIKKQGCKFDEEVAFFRTKVGQELPFVGGSFTQQELDEAVQSIMCESEPDKYGPIEDLS